MQKNNTTIILSAIFFLAIAFSSCSTSEPYDDKKNVGEWSADAPVGKLSIAVDEDNYDGLLKKVEVKPISDMKISISENKCFINIYNEAFANYIYVPQNFELQSGASYFYASIEPKKEAIVATDSLILNESFPLVTNIAYNFLKKINIREYVAKIDTNKLVNLGKEKIMGLITQEGGITIAQLSVTLKYTPGVTLKEYLGQLGMFDLFVIKIIKNLAGKKNSEVEVIIKKELSLAVDALVPILLENAKTLSIDDFLLLLTKDLGDLKDVVLGMINPLLKQHNVSEEMMKRPLGLMFDNLIDGAEYIQKNLKTAVEIKEFAILPIASTISLKKMKEADENSTVLVNNMNFKFTNLQLSSIIDSDLNSEKIEKLNEVFIPILNFGIPLLLNNSSMLPGEIGKTIAKANDFNYIVSSSLTKK